MKWMFKKLWMGGHGMDSSGWGWGKVVDWWECGNGPLGFWKCTVD